MKLSGSIRRFPAVLCLLLGVCGSAYPETVITMKDGICKDTRIVLGAVAPTPFRALAAEEAIRGKTLDTTTAEKAAEAAVSIAKPLGMNAYKIEIAKTLVKRALLSSLA